MRAQGHKQLGATERGAWRCGISSEMATAQTPGATHSFGTTSVSNKGHKPIRATPTAQSLLVEHVTAGFLTSCPPSAFRGASSRCERKSEACSFSAPLTTLSQTNPETVAGSSPTLRLSRLRI